MSIPLRKLSLSLLSLAFLCLVAATLWLRNNSQSASSASNTSTSKSSPANPSEGPSDLPTHSQTLRTAQPLGEESSELTQQLLEIQNYPEHLEWPGLLLDLMLDASLDEVLALLAASEGPLGASPGFRDEMQIAAYERWYALDPAAALRAIDTATMTPHRRAAAMEVFLDDWTSREPEQVSAFLKEGELEGVSADLAYGAVARGASLAGAVALVDEALARIEDPKLHSYAVRAAARQLQRDHAELFEDWLTALPVTQQGAALAESAWILSEKKIDQALTNLARLEQIDAERVPVTRARVVVNWAEEAPREAANWVAGQALQGEEREALFANLLSVWFSEEKEGAISWVESLIEQGQIDEAFMNRVSSRM